MQAIRDVVDVAGAVDLVKQTSGAVLVDEGGGLLAVDLLSALDYPLGVVGSVLLLGPKEEAPDEVIGLDRQEEHSVERHPKIREHRVQLF